MESIQPFSAIPTGRSSSSHTRLELAARDPRFRAMSIGKLNPTRSAGDLEAIRRFVRFHTTTLSAKDVPRRAAIRHRPSGLIVSAGVLEAPSDAHA